MGIMRVASRGVRVFFPPALLAWPLGLKPLGGLGLFKALNVCFFLAPLFQLKV